MKSNSKLLGDAGEHYALSQFSFAGKYAAKMPDNWEGYDLAVETGNGLVRVSVKTRSESEGWKTSKWYIWDSRKVVDWFVFVFKSNTGQLRSWAIPSHLVAQHSSLPGVNRKEPWFREISWRALNGLALSTYENNWTLTEAVNN